MPAFIDTSLKLCSILWRQGQVFVLIILAFFIAGQAAGQTASSYKTRYLGLKEGLSSRDVKAIYQDHLGMLWIATSNGLNRYDGHSITIYANSESSPVMLPSSNVRSIAEDKSQNLLLCTDAGLVALDPSRHHLVSASQLGFPDSVTRQTNCMIELLSDDQFLLLSGSSIYYYNEGQLSVWFRLPPGYAPTIKRMCYSKKDSTLYLRTNSLEFGLLAIHNKQMESLNFPIYVHGNIKSQPAVFSKQSHEILGCLGDSMTLFWQTGVGFPLQVRRAEKRFERSKTEKLPDIFPAWRAVQQGLEKLDESTLPGSMREINLKVVIKDNRDVYWLGTNVGVFMVRETKKSPFREFDFLKNISVRSIVQDETGDLLIGTYSGLFKYSPETGQVTVMPDMKTVLDMAAIGNKRYWITLERFNGLRIYDSHTQQLMPFYAEAPALSFVGDFARSDSVIWLAETLEKVYGLRVSDGSILYQTHWESYPQSTRDLAVKALLQAKNGSVWIASEGGLYRLVHEKQGRMVPDTTAVPALLRRVKINALIEDHKKRLWLGTDGQGLAVFSPESGKLKWYTSNDGLAHNVIFSVLESHQDSLLWIGTQGGLSCLNTRSGLFNNYYVEDGLADNEFNTGAAHRAKDGRLYFGGLNGITCFDPEQLIFSDKPAKAFLTIEMPNRGEAGNTAEWFPEEKKVFTIPASEGYLEIRFFSDELFDANKVRFRYTISGLYDEWQYSDAVSKLILRNLSPGYYNMCVQVITSAGQWSRSFQVSMRKLPLYHQTWWFRSLGLMLILALLYGAYRLRVWQIHREYNMRSRIANDLHDDLGSRLFALRAMASKITSPQTKGADLNALFEQFNAISKNVYGAMRDFIWAFDPKNDRLQNLVDRMSDFAENTLRPLIQELKIKDEISSLEAPVSPVVKHHALMIFQEILTNMAKHTFSKSLDIDFRDHKHQLCIQIMNRHEGLRNGGFSSGKVGIESINARLNAIKGKLEWLEEDGFQEISIWIPF